MTDQEQRLARLERRVEELEKALAAKKPSQPDSETAAATPPASYWQQPNRPAVAAVAAVAAPTPVHASQPPIAADPTPGDASWSLSDLEERLSGRLLAWVGGIALVVGGLFFLSLAFNRGWIGPEARILIGLVASAAALAAGAWLFDRGYGPPALALVAVGVAVGMLALYAASALYDFIPVEAALLGSLVLAIGAAAIAVRADSELVAGIGLGAVIAAPPVMGASPDLFTVLFLGTVLAGTTAISLWRSWAWLPGLALIGSAPQVASWLAGERSIPVGLAGIFAYWAVNAVAAGGAHLFRDRRALHPASAAVLALNALFALSAFRDLLGADLTAVRVSADLLLVAAHAAMAAPLLVRGRGRNPFGELAAGVAAGTLVIAIGLELGGVFRPIAWAAVATALAWFAIRLRHARAGAAAAIVGALAVAHFIAVEYPSRDLQLLASRPGIPFASPEAVVAAALVVAILLVAALGVRAAQSDPPDAAHRRVTLIKAAGGIAAASVIAWAAPFELPAFGAVILWSALAAGLFGVAPAVGREWRAATSSFVAGSVLIALATAAALEVVAPLDRLSVDLIPPVRSVVPVLNPATPALAALIVALSIGARAAATGSWARWSGIAAGAVAAWLVSVVVVDLFQAQVPASPTGDEISLQAQVALSIAWVVGGAAAFGVGLARRIPDARLFGLGLLGFATAKVFLFDLASLDVAYRVLSFMGLGLVLLGSSFYAVRLRAQRGTPPSGAV